jgi:hypothetical protein
MASFPLPPQEAVDLCAKTYALAKRLESDDSAAYNDAMQAFIRLSDSKHLLGEKEINEATRVWKTEREHTDYQLAAKIKLLIPYYNRWAAAG